MAEEERQQNLVQQQGQSQQQLQGLLRQTLKENKSLQNKNAKLESKYVELFKEQKALKKDHSLFIAFFNKYFAKSTQDSRPILPELQPGQYQMHELQKIAEQKEAIFRERVQQLENRRQQSLNVLEQQLSNRKSELQLVIKKKQQELTKHYQQKLQEANEASSKEVNSLLKEIESLRRSNRQQSEQLAQVKTSLEQKHNELSKLGKEKLKLQHQLNTIRKKEIAEELCPQQEQQNQKIMNERNEFLSLRQQLEAMMIKRDQLKRELTEKQQEISAQRNRNQILQREIQRLRKNQADLDQKYELVRQCTLEQLESLIFGQQLSKQQIKKEESLANEEPVNQQNAQIQHEYLKNILLRYIKAETTGSFDQALMLLQIIGTILKLDADSSTALENYKHKRKQWWYIKY